MAIINRYTGPAELTDGQKSDILHHRATGKRKCAGAYDPHVLVGPVKKARLIWAEWLDADKEPLDEAKRPPDRWLWGKIAIEKEGCEGHYRQHVMVEVKRGAKGTLPGIRETMKYKSANPPMRIRALQREWEAICDRVPYNPHRTPMEWSNGAPPICKDCISRANLYVSGFSSRTPTALP